MAGGGAATGTSLEYTPTWALATVCFVFISISIVLEHLIHLLTNWLKRHRKRALTDAVDKLKSELILLGFISLLLAVTQKSISEICISENLADKMLPCRKETSAQTFQTVEDYLRVSETTSMVALNNLSSFDHNFQGELLRRRRMAEEEDEDEVTVTEGSSSSNNSTDPCSSKGKVSLVTQQGLQQLQIFIFVLAVMQIVYSFLTMALGGAKMRRWEAWERETQTTEYQVANDPNRFRFTRDTSFGRRHMTNCTDSSFALWTKCFFRQFFHSVAKVDYFTLRHGFIAAHLSSRQSNFNFQKYIQRSLEEDFKVIVGISPLMWFIVVIFLLVDVHGWNVYLYVSYIPLLLVLVLGTKMEVIVARMALEIKNQNNVVIGTPLVQPNDKLFWFGHPKFVLIILHYTLFVNAFELAFFVWVTVLFGFDSCHHEHTIIIVTRLVLAVTVQVLCSYITLPLYALVTQMGSHFKGSVLEDQTANVIRQWHADVRERRKKLSEDPSSTFQSPARTSASMRPSPNYDFDGSSRRMRGEINQGEEDEDLGAGGSSRGLSSRGGMVEMPTVRR